MRFLNLEMTTPDIDDVKIEFSEGINVISISDKKLFDLLKYFPIIGIYGQQQKEPDQGIKEVSSAINILSSALSSMSFVNGEVIIQDNQNNKILKKENEQFKEQYKKEYKEEYKEDFKNIYSYENFIMSSYYYPELNLNNIDPLFEKGKIKQLLIKSEIVRLKFPYFIRREKLLSPKERELINLEKEKQLLELKRLKKEKIIKEIQNESKDLSKLEKGRDSIISYKAALDEIIGQIDTRNDISSKVNNLKKDIVELKGINENIKSVEKIISERFSRFSNLDGEQLPDIELIQETFNNFRDINEQIDNFSISKKKYSARLAKVIFSFAIFSLIAFMFLIFTSSASLILTFISSISAGISALTAIIYYFMIKRSYPAELLDRKNNIENNLIDILKKNYFPVDDYKTGELYEILLQYFDDFINFRDINNELILLKKKKSDFTSLTDNERQLKQCMSEIDKLNKEINKTINSLDASIHPLPAQEEIERAVHNIDELLEENQTEIDKKNSLIAKFQEEIDEYNRDEENLLSSDMSLEETIERIDNLTDEIKHIKFLDVIFNEAVEKWSTDKLEVLSNSALEKLMKITYNSYEREKLEAVIKNILIDSGKLNEEYMELKPYISLAIKAALSEQLNFTPLPPMFMIDPFVPNNEFSENMKNLLPEFFPDRQVIVIVNYIDSNINGNLITL